jgi:hypothetical protein
MAEAAIVDFIFGCVIASLLLGTGKRQRAPNLTAYLNRDIWTRFEDLKNTSHQAQSQN